MKTDQNNNEKSLWFKPTFQIYPKVITFHKKLSLAAKLLVPILSSFDYGGKGGVVYVGTATLGEILGCSRQKINAAINELIDYKFLARQRRKGAPSVLIFCLPTIKTPEEMIENYHIANFTPTMGAFEGMIQVGMKEDFKLFFKCVREVKESYIDLRKTKKKTYLKKTGKYLKTVPRANSNIIEKQVISRYRAKKKINDYNRL